MLSGSRPPGNSRAPASANTGRCSGKSRADRYWSLPTLKSLLRGFAGTRSRAWPAASGKQDRRQLAPRSERRLVGHAPRLEEGQKLVAGRIVLPLAVGLDDGQQMVGGGHAVAARILDHGEVEARRSEERRVGKEGRVRG